MPRQSFPSKLSMQPLSIFDNKSMHQLKIFPCLHQLFYDSFQVSQVEEELNKDWKEKCDKLLATQQEKHKRAIQEVKQENEELQSTIQQLEQKVIFQFL